MQQIDTKGLASTALNLNSEASNVETKAQEKLPNLLTMNGPDGKNT